MVVLEGSRFLISHRHTSIVAITGQLLCGAICKQEEKLHSENHGMCSPSTGGSLAVLYREVSLIQKWLCTQLCVVGQQTVSSLEMCALFSVPYREFHCIQ